MIVVFFFWVIHRLLNLMCRSFGTLCMKTELTACSETSAHKIWAPGNHPKERKNTTFRTWRKFEIKNNSL